MQAHAFKASLARETRLHEEVSIQKLVQGGREQLKQLRASQEAPPTPPTKYNEPGLNRIRALQPSSTSRTGPQIVLESIKKPAPEDWEEIDLYTSDATRMCSICHQVRSSAEVTLGHIGWICVECCRLLAEFEENELRDQESQAPNTQRT